MEPDQGKLYRGLLGKKDNFEWQLEEACAYLQSKRREEKRGRRAIKDSMADPGSRSGHASIQLGYGLCSLQRRNKREILGNILNSPMPNVRIRHCAQSSIE